MGVTAIPYDTVAKAKRFKTRMSKPWIAKVVKEKIDEDVYFRPNYSGWDLVGSDSLLDGLDATADRLKKDFDIRPLVKREVRAWLNVTDPTSQGDPLEAVNIVRVAVGLPVFDPAKVSKKTAPISFLKDHGFPIHSYLMHKIDTLAVMETRIYGIERFARRKDLYLFIVEFKSDKNLDELKSTLKERFDVLSVTKISPWRPKGRTIVIRMK